MSQKGKLFPQGFLPSLELIQERQILFGQACFVQQFGAALPGPLQSLSATPAHDLGMVPR
jgi:hypothetical protein